MTVEPGNGAEHVRRVKPDQRVEGRPIDPGRPPAGRSGPAASTRRPGPRGRGPRPRPREPPPPSQPRSSARTARTACTSAHRGEEDQRVHRRQPDRQPWLTRRRPHGRARLGSGRAVRPPRKAWSATRTLSMPRRRIRDRQPLRPGARLAVAVAVVALGGQGRARSGARSTGPSTRGRTSRSSTGTGGLVPEPGHRGRGEHERHDPGHQADRGPAIPRGSRGRSEPRGRARRVAPPGTGSRGCPPCPAP